MLSKKYYKEIAKIIAESKAQSLGSNPGANADILRAFSILEEKLRNYFAYDNDKFDRAKFTEEVKHQYLKI